MSSRWRAAVIIRPIGRPSAVSPAGTVLAGRLATFANIVRSAAVPAWQRFPPVSVGNTREEALSHVNVEGLCKWANKAKFWVKPASGSFETAEDLEGSLIAGTVDDVVEECERFAAIGTDHLVFDLRFRFDDYYDQMELLGEAIAKIRAS